MFTKIVYMILVWVKGIYSMDDIWTSNLKNTVDSIKNNNNVYTTGKVVKVNDYIIEVTGLNDVTFYEEVNVGDKASGYVSGIYPDRVIVALVNITGSVLPGDMVYALKKEFKCLFSLDSVGKVIDIFGNDLVAGKKFDNLVELKRLIEWVDKSSDEDFKDNIGRYFNLEYLLRYYLFVLVFGAVDSLGFWLN